MKSNHTTPGKTLAIWGIRVDRSE